MADEVQPDPLVGALFDGRYRVIRRLDGGGMGVVYLAEEVRLRRNCALKVLQRELGRERVHVERFLREAQTMARLSHPNIVNIFAYGEDPAGVFFVMELLAGEDMDTRIGARAQRPFDLENCCEWAIQLARAVGVVHKAGLVHRDLKAANVFLARQDGEEVVKLLDFGIARPVEGSELTGSGVALGTPSYMSPEQILNEPLDHRSDIYSFGVLLFKLFTGRVPFTGTPIQVTTQHCMSKPPRPSAVAPDAGIWPELESIVLRALAKQPGQRHASMLELEHALVAALRQRGGSPPRILQRQRPVTQYDGLGSTDAVPALPADAAEEPGRAREDAADDVASTAAMSRAGPRPRHARAIAVAGIVSGVVIVGLLAAVLLPRSESKAPRRVDVELDAPEHGLAVMTPHAPPEEVALEPSAARAIEVGDDSPPEPVREAGRERRAKAPTAGEALPDYLLSPPRQVKPRPAALRAIRRAARECRRQHDAEGGPKIAIEFSIGSDGKVIRAAPAEKSRLGRCLADAMQEHAVFPAGLHRSGQYEKH